jgi:hypothetical protein
VILRRTTVSLALLASTLSCELPPGNPWTIAEIEAEVLWDTDGRRTDDGLVKTAKNYRLEFESIGLSVANVQVETAVDGADTSFDPADPPEGYSLCHNGHCHNDEGQLIDYEDIILELGDGSASSQVVTRKSTQPILVEYATAQSTQSIALGPCDDPLGLCEVGPSDIRAMSLQLNTLVVKFRVIHETHFPAPGVVVDVAVFMGSKLSSVTTMSLGTDAPQTVKLRARLAITPQIWDRLEFKDVLDPNGDHDTAEVKAAIKSAFDEGASFTTIVSTVE